MFETELDRSRAKEEIGPVPRISARTRPRYDVIVRFLTFFFVVLLFTARETQLSNRSERTSELWYPRAYNYM